MKLPTSHPFIQLMLKAEQLEQTSGRVTDEVLALRVEAQERYPDYFKEYIAAKTKKQDQVAMKKREDKSMHKLEKEQRNKRIWWMWRNLPGAGRGPKDR